VEEAVAEAKRLLGRSIVENEPLAKHCSFRIGGPARLFLSAKNVATLKQALGFCGRFFLPFVVLGRGTNVLIPDSGFEGMVICVDVRNVEFAGRRVRAQAGASLQQVAKAAVERGLAGMEFCAGIPGSVGGAVVMNAGAHGEWIGSLVEEVSAFDPSGGEVGFSKEDLRFSYRDSNLRRFPGIVYEVTLVLRGDEPAAIKERMKRLLEIRRSSQPVAARCAGSVFKNAPGEAAGRLIDLAGCKGMRRGGAVVSRKHANFIVNRGGATYSDVKGLIEDVRERVRKAHGIELELEIIDLGDQP
jgi:UDP-N-acetylmuramate dehydrogenase